jgi:hypothetical protein
MTGLHRTPALPLFVLPLLIEEEEQIEGVPVCGANLSSPVVDTAYYIDEIHYSVGNRMYIENAD